MSDRMISHTDEARGNFVLATEPVSEVTEGSLSVETAVEITDLLGLLREDA